MAKMANGFCIVHFAFCARKGGFGRGGAHRAQARQQRVCTGRRPKLQIRSSNSKLMPAVTASSAASLLQVQAAANSAASMAISFCPRAPSQVKYSKTNSSACTALRFASLVPQGSFAVQVSCLDGNAGTALQVGTFVLISCVLRFRSSLCGDECRTCACTGLRSASLVPQGSFGVQVSCPGGNIGAALLVGIFFAFLRSSLPFVFVWRRCSHLPGDGACTCVAAAVSLALQLFARPRCSHLRGQLGALQCTCSSLHYDLHVAWDIMMYMQLGHHHAHLHLHSRSRFNSHFHLHLRHDLCRCLYWQFQWDFSCISVTSLFSFNILHLPMPLSVSLSLSQGAPAQEGQERQRPQQQEDEEEERSCLVGYSKRRTGGFIAIYLYQPTTHAPAPACTWRDFTHPPPTCTGTGTGRPSPIAPRACFLPEG